MLSKYSDIDSELKFNNIQFLLKEENYLKNNYKIQTRSFCKFYCTIKDNTQQVIIYKLTYSNNDYHNICSKLKKVLNNIDKNILLVENIWLTITETKKHNNSYLNIDSSNNVVLNKLKIKNKENIDIQLNVYISEYIKDNYIRYFNIISLDHYKYQLDNIDFYITDVNNNNINKKIFLNKIQFTKKVINLVKSLNSIVLLSNEEIYINKEKDVVMNVSNLFIFELFNLPENYHNIDSINCSNPEFLGNYFDKYSNNYNENKDYTTNFYGICCFNIWQIGSFLLFFFFNFDLNKYIKKDIVNNNIEVVFKNLFSLLGNSSIEDIPFINNKYNFIKIIKCDKNYNNNYYYCLLDKFIKTYINKIYLQEIYSIIKDCLIINPYKRINIIELENRLLKAVNYLEIEDNYVSNYEKLCDVSLTSKTNFNENYKDYYCNNIKNQVSNSNLRYNYDINNYKKYLIKNNIHNKFNNNIKQNSINFDSKDFLSRNITNMNNLKIYNNNNSNKNLKSNTTSSIDYNNNIFTDEYNQLFDSIEDVSKEINNFSKSNNNFN